MDEEDINQSTNLSARPEFDTFGRLGGTQTRKVQQAKAIAGEAAGSFIAQSR